MSPARARPLRWPRRAFLSLLPTLLSGNQAGSVKGRILEADWGRYPDPSTEFDVLRLTSAGYVSLLPSTPARAFGRKNDEVLYACDRTGSMQAHLMDIDTGRSRVLTAASELDPASLTFAPDSRTIYFFDGPRLVALNPANLKEQVIYTVREGWSRTGPVAVSEDHLYLYFVESQGSVCELRQLKRPRNDISTFASGQDGILDPTPNPKRDMILWLSEDGRLWTSTITGEGKRALETPAGKVLQAIWSPDGQAFTYLLQPADPRELVSIREQEIDSRADRFIAKTSQFACFNRNQNATVFLGASRNKAAPSILVLLRVTKREFTLCEHKTSNPGHAAPLFSPNSQRVIFESDRHGKQAIYTMKVDKLIEKTES